MPGKSKIIFPNLPYTDDFLRTMSGVLRWCRWSGAACGGGGRGARMWGSFVAALLLAIIATCFWCLVLTMCGSSIQPQGKGAVASKMVCIIFYGCALVSLVLTWRLSSAWGVLAARWAAAERAASRNVPPAPRLRRDMLTVTAVVFVGSIIEHLMYIIAAVGTNCPLQDFLRCFALATHAFLVQPPENYSSWRALIIFATNTFSAILWNLQDLIIILVGMGLSARYKRLNIFIASIVDRHWSVVEESTTRRPSARDATWRSAREAFARQAALVRSMDKALGGLMLLCNINNFFCLCLQLFMGGFSKSRGQLQQMYYLVSVVWLVARVVCVVLSAADVHAHAQRALPLVLTCPSHCYTTEVQRLQTQLSNDNVALTGMGFYELTRSFILKLVGAAVTYELVLYQLGDPYN